MRSQTPTPKIVCFVGANDAGAASGGHLTFGRFSSFRDGGCKLLVRASAVLTTKGWSQGPGLVALLNASRALAGVNPFYVNSIQPRKQAESGGSSNAKNAGRKPNLMCTLTPQDAGPFFRRNFSSRGIGRDQNQPRVTTPDLKPTPAWLGGWVRWRRSIKGGKWFLAPRPLLSTSLGACSDVPERRGSRGLFAL